MSASLLRGIRKDQLASHLPRHLTGLAERITGAEPLTLLFFSQDCVTVRALEEAIRSLPSGEQPLYLAESFTLEASRLASELHLQALTVQEPDVSDEMQESIDAIRRAPEPTKKQVEEARAELAVIASQKLGRALSVAEQEVIRGWDKWLVTQGYAAESLRENTAQQLLDEFAEMGAGPGPVALLKALAANRFDLTRSRERILEFLDPKARELAQAFDLKAAVESFAQWFLLLLRTEPPGRNIRALYFGLCELDGGCSVYVTGAHAYDPDDSDWACVTDWCPEKRYAPLDQLSELWERLHKAGNDDSWVTTQAIAIVLVRAFFSEHADEFKQLTGLKRVYIASGFDDGDLYATRTRLSPRA